MVFICLDNFVANLILELSRPLNIGFLQIGVPRTSLLLYVKSRGLIQFSFKVPLLPDLRIKHVALLLPDLCPIAPRIYNPLLNIRSLDWSSNHIYSMVQRIPY
jgi:hypothetical protein